jgi:trehalose 6-phosphate phosphatase
VPLDCRRAVLASNSDTLFRHRGGAARPLSPPKPHFQSVTAATKERTVSIPLSLPKLRDPRAIAFFLDFDGTLVELADRPDTIRLAERTRDVLSRLAVVTGGAVAIVTGREIADLDRFLAPLRLPAAGIHGLTRRSPSGQSYAAPLDDQFLRHAELLLVPLVLSEPGLLLERKSNAVALHYRRRPDLEETCRTVMEQLAALCPGIQTKRGKMVFEAKPNSADKGTAILDFLKEPPFIGRQPVVAGDDVTDEDAFAAVNAVGGIAIKIGTGATRAHYAASDTATFLDWLHATALALENEALNG